MSTVLEKIRRRAATTISDYRMIEGGDRVLAAVSGGKDSAVMLYTLRELRRRAPFPFDLHAILLDQGQPGFAASRFQKWVAQLGITLELVVEDTYSIVIDKTEAGKSYCGLCSRLRRGVIYNYAAAHGWNKIALGHHRDDLNETLLMNLFYQGKIASMPPMLHADDGRNTIIRPLSFIPEEWLAEGAAELGVPIIPCNLCGSQDGMVRQKMKKLLKDLEADQPGTKASLAAAQRDVRPTQLADLSVGNFAGSGLEAPC